MDLSSKLSGFSRAGKARQQKLRHELQRDPYEATKTRVRDQLDMDVEYRTRILKGVKTLQGLTSDELKRACESMEEQEWRHGEDIMRQGEKGDSLYLLKEGSVLVTRKNNPKDKDELPIVLAKLPRNACFGEIALLTEEPRSASITAIGVCITVQMKKKAFDEILAASNEKNKRVRQNTGMAVIESVPIFKDLSKQNKLEVLSLMAPVSYPIGSYICRQKGLGNTFFIIIEGAVRCTISDDDDGAEREVARLGPGSFFGEAALLDPSSIRTANIISVESTMCLSLSREAFTNILREIKQNEIQANMKKNMGKNKKNGASIDRRVTGMSVKTLSRTPAMHSIFVRMCRFLTESLWTNLYSKIFRDITVHPLKMEEYGDALWDVMRHSPNRVEAVKAIREQFLKLSKIPSEKRNDRDHAFICGVLRQNNKLKSVLCSEWITFQFTDLCKKCAVRTYKPHDSIINVAGEGTTMFLILRGAVRKWKGSARNNLVHDEDLTSGDIFGEEAMDGEHTRNMTVRALTNVDVAVFEEKDFFNALHRNMVKLTHLEKFTFLRGLQLFRRTDDSIVHNIAHVLQQRVYSRRKIVLHAGKVNSELMFVTKGLAEVVYPLNPATPHTSMAPNDCIAFAQISAGEVFGESGFVNNKFPLEGKINEAHFVISSSVLEVLVLPAPHYHMLDMDLSDSVKYSLKSKVFFRNKRVDVLQQEQQQVHSIKKSMKKAIPQEEQPPAASYKTEAKIANYPQVHGGRGSASRRSMSPTGTVVTGNIDGGASVAEPLPAWFTDDSNSTTTGDSRSNSAQGTIGGGYNFSGPITNQNFDMEDIPILMNQHFDPFMVLDACHDDRDQRVKQFMLRQLNRPRSVRSRGRDARESCVPGYLSCAIKAAGVNRVRPGTGSIGADVAKARFDAQRTMSASGNLNKKQGSSGNTITSMANSRSMGTGMGMSDDMSVLTVQTGLPLIRPSGGESSTPKRGSSARNTTTGVPILNMSPSQRPSSSGGVYLMGSASIPASMPYVDSINYGRPGTTGTSRPGRRDQLLSNSPPPPKVRPGTAPVI